MRVNAVVSAVEEIDKESEPLPPKERKSVRAVATGSGNGLSAEFRTKCNKFVIRVPASLRKKILQISRRHHRSMNTEIILLLGRYLEQQQFLEQGGSESHEPLESKLNRKLKRLSAEKRKALLALLD